MTMPESSFDGMTTDELLERLPNNLHLARNDNAPDHDRWRIYNSHTKQYTKPGFPTARELMVYTCNRLEEAVRSWIETPRAQVHETKE